MHRIDFTRTLAVHALALSTLVGALAAQTPRLVMKKGDQILGNGQIVIFNQIVVNDAGLYYADVTSDEAGADDVILLNGFMALVQGTPLAEPEGVTLNGADPDGMSMNDQGYVAWPLKIDGSTNGNKNDEALYWNTLLLAQEGEGPAEPSVGGIDFTPDTAYSGFVNAWLNDDDELLVLGTLDDPGFRGKENYASIIRTDGAGRLMDEEFLAVRRYPIPGVGEDARAVVLNRDAWAFNDAGDWLGQVQTDSSVLLLKSGEVELRSLEELPAKPGSMLLGMVNLDMNKFGDYAVNVITDDPKPTDTAIIVNGTDVLVNESDSFPGLSPFSIVRFDGAPVKIADSGDVFWYAQTDNVSAADRYYFRSVAVGPSEWKHTILVQEGTTNAGNGPVSDLRSTAFAFDISDSGRFWIGEVLLSNGDEGILLADFGSSVPMKGCTGVNEGTLQKVDGDPLTGTRLVYEVDGPIQTGTAPFVYWSTAPAIPGSECGLVAGMKEVLVNPGPAFGVGRLFGAAYAGSPVSFDLDLPPDPLLVDRTFYGQAFYVTTNGRGRLTNGVEMTIGAPN